MQFEYDPELLIEQVKKRPALWNFDDEYYRNREIKRQQWIEIVEELIDQSDGVKISKSEKRQLEQQIQKKWKDLKDSFQRYWKNPNRTRRPYIYYKQLLFLVKQPDGETAEDTNDDDQGKQRKWIGPRRLRRKLTIVKDESTPEHDDDNDYHQDELIFSNDEDEISVPTKIARTSQTIDEFAFANVDPELLIEQVKTRPALWNFDDINYRNKEIKRKQWIEIVEELIDQNDGVKISKSEKRELELQIQKKWKDLKDSFQKYWKNPSRTRRPYIYYKQLLFLVKQPDGETAEETNDDDLGNHRKWIGPRKVRRTLTIVKDDESTPEHDDDNDYEQEELIFSNDEDEISVPRSVDEFAFANVDSKKEDNDPDRMFLVSLLPHLKTIPEKSRLDAKVEIMQVLRNANYNTKMI